MKINGSLVFDASSASEIQNLRIEKLSALPSFVSADVGRLVYITTSEQVYFGDANSWMPLASGGSAFSQAEGDATQASIGPAVNSDGTFNAAAFNAPIVSATSVTNAINQLAAYADQNNTLGELDDVTLTGLASGDYLKFNGSVWVNDALTLADVTDVTTTATELNQLHSAGAVQADFIKLHAVTADAAELNILDGATLSTTELNYVDGVTSPIQAQLNNLQAGDPDLTAIAGLTGTGIAVRSAADTWVLRTLVAPAAGIAITNADGTSGNPTFALANDLLALESLSTIGYVVRTGDGTATTREITGASGRIVVTNGTGVASNTDVDLASLTDSGTGTFLKLTRDAYGRVAGTTAVVQNDITTLVSGVYVDVAGDTMTGNLNMGTFYVTMDNAPTTDTQATNKAYVDAIAAGLTWKNSVKAATTTNITLSGTQTVDGVALVAGDRVLVKDQTTTSENGIYVVAAGAWTRSTSADTPDELNGAAVLVTGGTANDNSGWTQTADVVTVGTSPVVWTQFSGASTYTWGTGLGNTGNTIFVKLGAGIVELPSDEVGIDVVSGLALQLTSTASAGQLTFVLDTGSGLEQSATGLKISANGVTNAMLLNEFITFNGDAGTTNRDLGSTLIIAGTSVQGISTSVSGGTLTITAADATTGSKGVASFSSGDFDVTGGVVTIKTAGIDNGQLANSTINFVGTNASADTVALGESLTFSSTVPNLVVATVAANGVALDVRLATTTATGVASFDPAHFDVTAGAVSLVASLDDLTNVSSADAASTGDLLTKSAGDWVPVSRTALAGTIALGDLSDVGSAAPTTAGQVLVADGDSWEAKAIYFLHDQTSSATTWTVTHALGQRYCNVTVVDSTNEVVIPQSITFNSTTQLTVTFNTAITGKVVVMGVA